MTLSKTAFMQEPLSQHPSPSQENALSVDSVSYQYGERAALVDFSLQVRRGSITGLLGPNGGGKTTLFRILSTLKKPMGGSIRLFDIDPVSQAAAARRKLGVVFQNPSLDKKLTVLENLRHQGHLHGLRGRILQERIGFWMEGFRIADRARDQVEALSGGLQRRVELAKSLLHDPEFLLMDEPSTGLDPGARIDLWTMLEKVRRERGMTVLLTTHLMEEAAKCDLVAILHKGQKVAEGTPAELQASVGGDVLSLEVAGDASGWLAEICRTAGCEATVVNGEIRIETADGPALITKLMQAHGEIIRSVRLGRPTLEDVFVARTGHRFSEDSEPATETMAKKH